MHKIAAICEFLERFAPSRLAEEWDNVGLLVGDRAAPVTSVMTCLTVTPASVREAIDQQANLIVTHHPFPFRATKRLTADNIEGRMLLELIGARISVYSPHTAFDSAAVGINHQLASGLGLTGINPLVEKPWDEDESGLMSGNPLMLGAGRHGVLPQPEPLGNFLHRVKKFLGLSHVKFVGDMNRPVRSVAVACGSAGEFLSTAAGTGADCFVTGETSFHTCLEAESLGMALVLTGHFASERFAVVELADVLSREYPGVKVWASREEVDPLQFA